MNTILKDSFGESVLNINNDSQFTVEFYAYNFSSQGLVNKVYYYPTLLKDKEYITLSPDELSLLSEVLNNGNLLSFKPDIYTLCDFSIRGAKQAENVGFSFKIIDDSNYIHPYEIFKPFSDFNVHDFCNTIIQIQDSLFINEPKFNPFSMIGLLFDKTSIKAIKAYVRFDNNEIKTSSEREKIIKKVISTINPRSTNKKVFLNTTKIIERLGFLFAFVGIDYDIAGNSRFKLYYRTSGEYDSLRTFEETKDLLSYLGLYDNIADVSNDKHCGMWGFAISTTDFTDINGVQLYFFP